MTNEMKMMLFKLAVLMVCVFELGYILLNVDTVIYDFGAVKTFWAVFVPMVLMPVCFEGIVSSKGEDS